MLLGHTLTYALENRTLADGHHAYFVPLLEVLVASALVCCALLVGRAISNRGLRTMQASPPLWRLWLIAASAQTAGFVMLEVLEGNAPDAFGCAVQVVMALLAALTIALFYRVIERCALAISSSYAGRVAPSRDSVKRLVWQIDVARILTVRTGIRRFKRPPPVFG